MGDVDPQNFSDEAGRSVEASEEDRVDKRWKYRQPESAAMHREHPTKRMGEGKVCRFEVDSDLSEGVRGGELGADAADGAERWSEPTRQALDIEEQGVRNLDGACAIANTGAVLGRLCTATRLVEQVAK